MKGQVSRRTIALAQRVPRPIRAQQTAPLRSILFVRWDEFAITIYYYFFYLPTQEVGCQGNAQEQLNIKG